MSQLKTTSTPRSTARILKLLLVGILSTSLGLAGMTSVSATPEVDGITAINAGGASVTDYSDAGITGVVTGNLTAINVAVAAAKTTKGSDLISSEIQTAVTTEIGVLAAAALATAAETAVAAYEAAPVTTLGEVTTAEGLKAAADTAVAALATGDAKTAFAARVTTKTTAIATAKTSLQAAVVVPVSTPTIDYAAIAAANAASETAKVAAAKAAAQKVLEDKLAAEKAAADKVIADAKAEAEAKVIAEAKAKADAEAAAVVAAIEKKAAANTVKINNSSKGSTKLNMNLADKYYGDIVYIEVRTKTKTGFKTRVVDSFVVTNEDGSISVSVKKLLKGQTLRIRVGKAVLFSKAL